jgi:hypothetical protein
MAWSSSGRLVIALAMLVGVGEANRRRRGGSTLRGMSWVG